MAWIKVIEFHSKGKQPRRQWILVGGVHVEIHRRYPKVLGVRRLQDQHAALRERPVGLGDQLPKDIKLKVLGNMKPRNQRERPLFTGPQCGDRIAILGSESPFLAGGEHTGIKIDTAPL
jgi:hypothetical protein